MSPSDCESGYDLALGLVLLLLMGAGFVGAAGEGLDQASKPQDTCCVTKLPRLQII